jgi:transposase
MSLKPQAVCPVPQETARVARAAYPKGNMYMQMRDVLGSIYTDEDFADLFPKEGQPTDRSVAFSLDHRDAISGEPV